MSAANQEAPIEDFDPLTSDDPDFIYGEFDRLRVEAPLAFTQSYGGYWALTRYEDVKNAASDSKIFISSVRAVVPSDPRGLRRPPLNFDAPRHTPYRRALDRTLQRSRLARLEPIIREHARRELQAMLESGGGDFASEFGSVFPAWVTAEWLNLEKSAAPVLAKTAAGWVGAWRQQDAQLATQLSESMYEIARNLVEARAESAMDVELDPASSLLGALDDSGQPLEREHIVAALRQSLVVGMVAPPILLGAIANHLSADPELQTFLRNNPEKIPAAIEEFVRLYSPYRGFARTVSEPVTLHGRTIEPDVPVTLAYAAANRDPAMFENPSTFVLDRLNIDQHLGFGRGRHACAGMPLARLSLKVALEELLANTASFSTGIVSGGARMPELGPTSVPMRLVAAAG